MNSNWNNLYDRFKDRRYAVLFFLSAVASVGVLAIGKVGFEAAEAFDWTPLLPGIFILVGISIWRVWRRSCQPQERLKFKPLSSDELQKARSKLMRKVG
ncbi:MAG TPA: hypothetical protein VH255_08955 [Verrucomicrobiae bacterium]|jgi:hypothetical protein|nr:hypothetical protein [Verrucomicrobiae bacterium]